MCTSTQRSRSTATGNTPPTAISRDRCSRMSYASRSVSASGRGRCWRACGRHDLVSAEGTETPSRNPTDRRSGPDRRPDLHTRSPKRRNQRNSRRCAGMRCGSPTSTTSLMGCQRRHASPRHPSRIRHTRGPQPALRSAFRRLAARRYRVQRSYSPHSEAGWVNSWARRSRSSPGPRPAASHRGPPGCGRYPERTCRFGRTRGPRAAPPSRALARTLTDAARRPARSATAAQRKIGLPW